MNRIAIACAIGMMAMVSWGATTPLPGGWALPELNAGDKAITADGASMRLRKPQDVYLTPGADGTIVVILENARVTTNNQPLEWALYDSLGAVVQSGSIPVSKTLKLKTKILPKGLYRLHLDAGASSARVSGASGVCCIRTDFRQPFHSIFECPRMYFLTKPSADNKAHIEVWGDSYEVCGATIWDANGKEIYKGSMVTPENRLTKLDIALPVPADQLGRAWSIQLTDLHHPKYRFEDMFILLKDGTVPTLALTPSALAIPGAQRFMTRTGDGGLFVGLALSRELMARRGASAEFTFEHGMDGKVEKVFKDVARAGDGKSRVGLTLKRNEPAIGRMNAIVKDENGRVLDQWSEMVFIIRNKLYNEAIREEEGTPAQPTATEQTRGFQIFQRNEPGFVRRYSRPATNEIISELKGECSPAMVSTEFFALQPLKAFDSATLGISNLTGPKGAVLPAAAIGLFSLKPHLQKVDYHGDEVIHFPEIFDRNVTVSLRAKTPQLFCVQTRVAADTLPGVYRGMLTLNGKDLMPYTLTVDDFMLPEDPAMSFGLYSDTKRWLQYKYTDEQILAELRMFRDYGMTALLMYPMLTAKLSWDGKHLAADLTEFRKHVKMLKATGFYGVLVVDLQEVFVKIVPKLLGVKDFLKSEACWNAYRDLLTAIRAAAREDAWPRYCIHTTDEPSGSERGDLAIETLKFTHAMGFKTFNTCYGEFVRTHLDPHLDYRCYNNVCYSAFPNEEAAVKLRRETLDAGDEFWWYGSGSYNNGKFEEDGNIYTNRHLLGIHNWRTRATGAWSWTFCRPYGNQYDDFDSAKDDCMAFQDPTTNTMISALQWEGAREGIYDHRYLVLWENTVTAVRTHPALKKLADNSEKRIGSYLKTISWTARQFAVDNGQLRKMRQMLIAEIKALNNAMK